LPRRPAERGQEWGQAVAKPCGRRGSREKNASRARERAMRLERRCELGHERGMPLWVEASLPVDTQDPEGIGGPVDPWFDPADESITPQNR
jgi:hypothetical protein